MTTCTIVAGVNGSRHSTRALEWCAQYAPRLDARVVVVYAVEVPVSIGIGFGDRPRAVRPVPEPEHSEIERVVRARSGPILAAARTPLEVVCMQGEPFAVLQHVAHRVGADLVVVGSHDAGHRPCGMALAHHIDRALVVVP